MKNKTFILKYSTIMLLLTLVGCMQSDSVNAQATKTNIDDYNKYKSKIPKTDKDIANDHWDFEVYRNSKYHFLIQFPKNWEYDRGTSESTLARALNRKKGIAISITVQHLVETPKNPYNIFESVTIDDFKNNIFDQLLLISQNTSKENFKIEKGSLNNYPAYIYEFTTIQSAGTQTYQFYSKQVRCYYNSKIYQLNINLPVDFYDEDVELLFNHVIYSFKFNSTTKN